MNASTDTTIDLPGLDGSNPLAFLAAIGLLRLASVAQPSARWQLSWDQSTRAGRLHFGGNYPPQNLEAIVSKAATLAATVFEIHLSQDRYPSASVNLTSAQFQKYMGEVLRDAFQNLRQEERFVLQIAAALGVPTGPEDAPLSRSLFSFANGQSNLYLFGGKTVRNDRKRGGTMETMFGGLRTLVKEPDLNRLIFDAVSSWRGEVGYPSFCWCPTEHRPGAFQNPVSDMKSVPGANVLAFFGLSYFPVVPSAARALTSGFQTVARRDYFSWPLWSTPCSDTVIASVVGTDWTTRTDRNRLACGVFAVWRSERLEEGEPPRVRYYFASSSAV